MVDNHMEHWNAHALQGSFQEQYTWKVRACLSESDVTTVYTSAHAFRVGPQASFTPTTDPSAIDYLLGALGGDLISGLRTQAARRGIIIDEMEVSVSGTLNNPLVFLGVIGEEGHPGVEAIQCIIYVSADMSDALLQEIWQLTLARSPLVHTLQRCVTLSLDLQHLP